MNTETKHTPGRWEITPSLTGEVLTIEGQEQVVPGCARDTFRPLIARVYSGTVYHDARALNANARLIAAAPDLLAALKHARALVAARDIIMDRAAVAMYDAAITKAEGGTP